MIPHGGDICVIDEHFIASRREAFSIYDFNANLVEYIKDPFLSISDSTFHRLNICNGKSSLLSDSILMATSSLSDVLCAPKLNLFLYSFK
jgi:hypothetical protein